MIPSVHYFFAGYRVLSACGKNVASLLEICRIHGLIYEDFRYTEGGGISLRFPLAVARRVEHLCAEQGVPVTRLGEGGFPVMLRGISRRAGLVVGLVLGILLIEAARSVVWDIRISGNETVSNRSVEEALAASGFFVGASLRGFEADKTENDVLMQDDRLAWISINRKGTVAYVEVREKAPRPTSPSEAPCDIVAAIGGVIERVELEEGNVRVYAGQLVGEGQILVSGLYDSMTQGIRITSAKARVYARTTRILSVEIPLRYEQKIYQTALDSTESGFGIEKSLIFFGNHIKFSKKTGNFDEFYDTIIYEDSWGLVPGVGFPISTRTVWYLPYTVVTATRTLAEAEELAYVELARQIRALPGGPELIGKSIVVHHGEKSLTLTCTLTCIEDIGQVRPIEVAP